MRRLVSHAPLFHLDFALGLDSHFGVNFVGHWRAKNKWRGGRPVKRCGLDGVTSNPHIFLAGGTAFAASLTPEGFGVLHRKPGQCKMRATERHLADLTGRLTARRVLVRGRRREGCGSPPPASLSFPRFAVTVCFDSRHVSREQLLVCGPIRVTASAPQTAFCHSEPLNPAKH